MNLVRIDMISWKFAVGIHFCSVDKWLQQREVFFDTGLLDSEDHTSYMSIDRPIRYATEVQYKWSDRLSYQFSVLLKYTLRHAIRNKRQFFY